MCGRFALTATPAEVAHLFAHVDRPEFPPREEIAPTEPIGIVRLRQGARRFDLVRWGFVPAWAPDPGAFSLLINARAETAATKPSFRTAMRHGRCLVPATAWWEWGDTPEGRRAHLVRRTDGGVFALAGLVETWAGADGSEIDTAAILTVDANSVLSALHPRMPAVIPPERFEAWLDTVHVDVAAARRLLVPAPAALFVARPTPTAADRRRAARPRRTATRPESSPTVAQPDLFDPSTERN
jgi:putative SOS response-associated peptidase YedK